jgi:L-asparaginase II
MHWCREASDSDGASLVGDLTDPAFSALAIKAHAALKLIESGQGARRTVGRFRGNQNNDLGNGPTP